MIFFCYIYTHVFRKKASHNIMLFIYTSSGVLNLTVPRSMTGKQLKKLVLIKMKPKNGLRDHALLYNNQCIDVEKSIGVSVPHNSSIMLQVIGRGGGRQSKKQQTESASDNILGEQIDTHVSQCRYI